MRSLLASAHESTIEKSLRRSRGRTRTLLAADVLGIAYPRRLSEEADVPESRLEALMHGEDALYREEFGLVRLGLIREEYRAGQLHYAITDPGRAIAADVRARRARGDRLAPRE